MDGAAELRWKRMKGARMFYLQFMLDPHNPELFEELGFTSKTRFTATGLIPGLLYWFRISAFGPVEGGE